MNTSSPFEHNMCVGDEYEDLRLFGGAVADFADRRRVPFGNNVKKAGYACFFVFEFIPVQRRVSS